MIKNRPCPFSLNFLLKILLFLFCDILMKKRVINYNVNVIRDGSKVITESTEYCF